MNKRDHGNNTSNKTEGWRKRKWGTLIEEELKSLANHVSILTELSDEYMSCEFGSASSSSIDNLLDYLSDIRDNLRSLPSFFERYQKVFVNFNEMFSKHQTLRRKLNATAPSSPSYSPASPSYCPLTRAASPSFAPIAVTMMDEWQKEEKMMLSNSIIRKMKRLISLIEAQFEVIESDIQCWKRQSILLTFHQAD